MTDNRGFGLKISKRLDEASRKRVDGIVKDIIKMAKDTADSPEKWPLTLDLGKYKEVSGCPRVLDVLADVLEEYSLGIIPLIEQNVINIDIIDLELEEEKEEKKEEKGPKIPNDIPVADRMFDMSINSTHIRLLDSISKTSNDIKGAALVGKMSIIIDCIAKPISGQRIILKKLLKRLRAKGYKLDETGEKVISGVKLDYGSITKIGISWNKPPVKP